MVNVAGGLKVSEPAADLGIALAIASSLRGTAIDPNLVAIGELGLSGELRAVPHLERRLNEAAKLGFKRCLLPTTTKPGASPGDGAHHRGIGEGGIEDDPRSSQTVSH